MSVATTICERCCTLHIAGRHSKCFRDLTEERRAELMRGMRGGEAEAGKMRDGTCEASSRRLHARERGMAGWWRDFSGNGAPDFEFTVEDRKSVV